VKLIDKTKVIFLAWRDLSVAANFCGHAAKTYIPTSQEKTAKIFYVSSVLLHFSSDKFFSVRYVVFTFIVEGGVGGKRKVS